MFTIRYLLSTALIQVAAAIPVDLTERQSTCENIHFFIARGTDEEYPGRQGALVNAVCEGMSSCGYEDIIYPASLDPIAGYCDSAFAGVTNGTAQITAYAESCPDSQLILTGYSQGAHVVGDILGGGGGNFSFIIDICTQPTNTPLSPDSSPGNKIVAATFFGDLRHTASQTYNAGTGADENGVSTLRLELQSLNRFTELLQSWCFVDDPVCARGGDSDAHTAYFNDEYLNEYVEACTTLSSLFAFMNCFWA
ncbi:carbohydrate esterase family 5 protein [Hypoxylon sp. EC38]|nr:carbohydrate esterase family 5 protein [Hypoxylon sp. EC38]